MRNVLEGCLAATIFQCWHDATRGLEEIDENPSIAQLHDNQQSKNTVHWPSHDVLAAVPAWLVMTLSLTVK